MQTRLYGWKALPFDPECFRNFQPKILPSKWKVPPVYRYERAVYKERGWKILTGKNSGLVNLSRNRVYHCTNQKWPEIGAKDGLKK